MFHSYSIVAATLLALASSAMAEGNDAEGCKDPALLSRFPGFNIQRCTLNDFAAHKFIEGNKEVSVEGRYTEIMYFKDEVTKAPSPLQVRRNYENAVTKIGGILTANTDEGDTYLKLAKDGSEVWIHVNINIAEQYLLRIVEKGEMKQEIEADAAALDAGIKSEGRIAVYGIHPKNLSYPIPSA